MYALGEKKPQLNKNHYIADNAAVIGDECLIGINSVILLGADSPTLSAKTIITASNMVQQFPHFVIGPAYDGGFYLFAGNKDIPQNVWQTITYSNETTLKQLSTKLAKLAKIEFLQPLLDVDTYDDLVRLNTELRSATHLLPAQKELLDWLA